jgi:predicted ATPase/transcriptional regulator with XRE-family HTH domain
MQEQSTFGVWLKQRRKDLDLTQAELAERMNCATITLQKFEAGQRRPSKEMAKQLASCLQIPQEQHDDVVRAARNGIAPADIPVEEPVSPRPQLSLPPLPVPLTPLLGRQTELSKLNVALQTGDKRLITVTGPGGVGKTRLILEVAKVAAENFLDGAAYFSLVTLRQPSDLLPLLARAFDIPDTPTLRQDFYAVLRSRHLLLVLDNFEHVIEAAPDLNEMLIACPRLKILVTSRERLRVRGEYRFPLTPLPLPTETDIEHIALSPAVELFLQTIQSLQPDFMLMAENAEAIAQLCQRLDGLPLAIELLAAHVPLLGLRELQARMEQGLVLASPGSRDLHTHQQTLRSTLDWSYRLLDAEEQRLFEQLSVFVGGWTLEALEAIANTPETVLRLGRLADKSLVQHPDLNSVDRFMLLETIRDYAQERLMQSGTASATRQAHAAYFLTLAVKAKAELTGPDQAVWIERLIREYPNLRAALDWSLHDNQIEQAAQLAVAIWRLWWTQNMLSEGRQWCVRILAHRQQIVPLTLARLLNATGVLTNAQGMPKEAVQWFEESLSVHESLPDSGEMYDVVHNLATTLGTLGEYKRSFALLEESLTYYRGQDSPWDLALTLGALASQYFNTGNYEKAKPLFEESLRLHRQLNDHYSILLTLNNMAAVMQFLGDLPAARRYFQEALALQQTHGWPHLLPYLLINQAGLALNEGDEPQVRTVMQQALVLLKQANDLELLSNFLLVAAEFALKLDNPARAVTLLGALSTLQATQSIVSSQGNREDQQSHTLKAQAFLGEEAFNDAWQAGCILSLEQLWVVLPAMI